MPLSGSWTDSTGNGVTYPNAYLVAHERIDTRGQRVLLDVKIYLDSSHTGFRPLYEKTLVPNSSQIDTVVALIEGRADQLLQTRQPFNGMSTTA